MSATCEPFGLAPFDPWLRPPRVAQAPITGMGTGTCVRGPYANDEEPVRRHARIGCEPCGYMYLTPVGDLLHVASLAHPWCDRCRGPLDIVEDDA